ncbi:MAG: excinuclease ABC subunit UvrA, partial [Clostridia bacterium]|nr:excinuclease ABC subunit UvrA [Clostridia bacterium]
PETRRKGNKKSIKIIGAKENNLKNIDIEIPKNSLVVMTGVSGSGKSSLAFDTIYAEGQRRYVESLSSYARQFLGGTSKPDVDSIEGLSPSISIDQKSTNNNPRSTVGTVTELYDYFRLLFARIGVPYCPNHKEPIKSQSIEEMTNKIMDLPEGTKLEIMAPVVRGENGAHQQILDDLRKNGYSRVRVNGVVRDLSEDIVLEKNKKDVIEVVVDRVIVRADERSRIFESIENTTKLANGIVLFRIIDGEEFIMSENYACVHCNYSMPNLETRMFSFNSPFGACPECNGLGMKMKISEELLMPNKDKSIRDGAIVTLSEDQNTTFTEVETVAKYYGIDLDAPVKKIPKDKLDKILYGSVDVMDFKYVSKNGNIRTKTDFFEGIINNLERRYVETTAGWIREWIEGFMIETECR